MNKFLLAAAVVGIVVEAGDWVDGTLCGEGTTCLSDCVNATCPLGSCLNAGTFWTSAEALWKCGNDPNATTAAPSTVTEAPATDATAAPETNATAAPATNATEAPVLHTVTGKLTLTVTDPAAFAADADAKTAVEAGIAVAASVPATTVTATLEFVAAATRRLQADGTVKVDYTITNVPAGTLAATKTSMATSNAAVIATKIGEAIPTAKQTTYGASAMSAAVPTDGAPASSVITTPPAVTATEVPATATEAPAAPAAAPATTAAKEEGSSMPTWAIALLAIAGLAIVLFTIGASLVMGGNKKKDKKKGKKDKKKDEEAPPAQVEPLVSPQAQPQPQAFAMSVGPVHAPAQFMQAPPVYSTGAPVHSAGGAYTMLPTSHSAVPVYTQAPQSHMLVSSAQAPVITQFAQPQ